MFGSSKFLPKMIIMLKFRIEISMNQICTKMTGMKIWIENTFHIIRYSSHLPATVKSSMLKALGKYKGTFAWNSRRVVVLEKQTELQEWGGSVQNVNITIGSLKASAVPLEVLQ